MALLMTFKVIQQDLSDNYINQYQNLEKAPFTYTEVPESYQIYRELQ